MFGFFARGGGGGSLELEDDRVLGNGIVRVQEVFDLETPLFCRTLSV